MEHPAGKVRSVKEKPDHSSPLTVMIVGKVGKARSFKTSSRFVFWTFLFFLFYISASVIVINDYFDKRRVSGVQSEQLIQLEYEIDNTKRELYRSEQHLALLEEYIYNSEKERETLKEPEEKESKEPDEGITEEKTELAADRGQVESPAKDVREKSVEIRDLAVQIKGTKLIVKFRLFNVHQDETPMSGYVHIIAMDKQSDPPQFWTFPKVALRNGIPVNYKRGQLFFIKRFKTIRGEYFMGSKSESPSLIKVIVYNEAGTLILQKEFEVEYAS